jgi:4-alpha-glucanotransferase
MNNHFPRESGVLLHITSLPGKYGMGEIGPNAYKFIDNLQKMGQKLWQILPIGPFGDTVSPYQLSSSFAGNPLFISFDLLVDDGLLLKEEIEVYFPKNSLVLDFKSSIPMREKLLDKVGYSFESRATKRLLNLYNDFCIENIDWLDSFATYSVIRKSNNLPWFKWEKDLRKNKPNAVSQFVNNNKEQIKIVKTLQFIFDYQWKMLREYANNRDIRIIGDIPIYVAHDSADVWENPELFNLNRLGNIKGMSGAPPCSFSNTGQIWETPTFNWENHKKTNFDWWIRRIEKLYEMVDIVRIDHFNGIMKYWEISSRNKTGAKGKWIQGPGFDFVDAINQNIGNVPLIAEDLGEASKEAQPIREKYGYPGMEIFQHISDNKMISIPNYSKTNVLYTGTHDNNTIMGWFNNDLTKTKQSQVVELFRNNNNVNWEIIRLVLKSNSNTVIIPLQDILGFDSKSRMNIPGTANGNWTWRFTQNMISNAITDKMKELTHNYNRN